MMIACMKEMAHLSWDSDNIENYFEELKDVTNYSIRQGTECICNNAFENCVSLKKLSIPNSVKAIGGYPFLNCDSLEHISVPLGSELQFAQLLPKYEHLINKNALPF